MKGVGVSRFLTGVGWAAAVASMLMGMLLVAGMVYITRDMPPMNQCDLTPCR